MKISACEVYIYTSRVKRAPRKPENKRDIESSKGSLYKERQKEERKNNKKKILKRGAREKRDRTPHGVNIFAIRQVALARPMCKGK